MRAPCSEVRHGADVASADSLRLVDLHLGDDSSLKARLTADAVQLTVAHSPSLPRSSSRHRQLRGPLVGGHAERFIHGCSGLRIAIVQATCTRRAAQSTHRSSLRFADLGPQSTNSKCCRKPCRSRCQDSIRAPTRAQRQETGPSRHVPPSEPG